MITFTYESKSNCIRSIFLLDFSFIDPSPKKRSKPVCPLFCACVRLELLLFNQDRQNLLTIFVSHESWPNFLLSYFCFQFQSHQKLANFATFTTQFCKQFQNDNSVTNMALKLKQKRLSGQCHLNFKVSFQLSHKFIKNSV